VRRSRAATGTEWVISDRHVATGTEWVVGHRHVATEAEWVVGRGRAAIEAEWVVGRDRVGRLVSSSLPFIGRHVIRRRSPPPFLRKTSSQRRDRVFQARIRSV
jgi:hypothetical protein